MCIEEQFDLKKNSGKAENGWFQKISIPYHRQHEYFNPLLALGNSKMLFPPPPHALRISKFLTPPPLWNFPFFFRPFGIPVRLPKTSNEWETCTVSSCKIILFTIFGQTTMQLKFVNVSTPQLLLLSVIFKGNLGLKTILTTKLAVSTGNWSAASEVYVEDVFMSFRKYCRGMSQHELQD